MEHRKDGWYVILEGNFSIMVGPDEPSLVPGDELIVTLEKENV